MLEALVASLLLALGLTAVLWALSASSRVICSAQRRSVAALLVEEGLEQARSADYDDVQDTSESGADVGMAVVVSRTLEVAVVEDGLKEIAVTVSYTDGGGVLSISGRSLVRSW